MLARGLSLTPDVTVVSEGLLSRPLPGDGNPDVVVLDFELHRGTDLQAALARRDETDRPILVLTPTLTPADGARLAALGFPTARRRPDLGLLVTPDSVAPITDLLRAVAETAPRSDTTTRTDDSVGSPPASATVRPGPPPRPTVSRGPTPGTPSRLVVIGASTGGPQAVRKVLEGLAPDPRWAIAIVQHISPQFSEGFARWLTETTGHQVQLAADGAPIQGGTAVVAPGNRHLLVRATRYALDDGPKRMFQRPAANHLFDSAAATWSDRVLGILLTGMGHDGGEGARAIVDAGGVMLVQDEESSVIFGMPRAAITAGGASEVLPLDAIAPRAMQLLGRAAVS